MIRTIARACLSISQTALSRAACIPAALAIGGLDWRVQRAHDDADRLRAKMSPFAAAVSQHRAMRDCITSDALEMARAEAQLLRGEVARLQREVARRDREDEARRLLHDERNVLIESLRIHEARDAMRDRVVASALRKALGLPPRSES